jgi:hypothetical protein
VDISSVSGGSLLGAQYDVLVARKVLANTREQGQAALALIQAAAAPRNVPADVGSKLAIVA